MGPHPGPPAASSATPPTTASLWRPGKTPPTGAHVQVRHHLRRLPHAARRAARPRATGTRSSTPQLAHRQPATLCVECHNGEIPEGTTASPGTEIHHPMKEMIDGYGAIDVSAFPSVHKGKCVQCHMPPTTTSPTGGNHTFKIIEPEMPRASRSRSHLDCRHRLTQPREPPRDHVRPTTRGQHAVLGLQHVPRTTTRSRRRIPVARPSRRATRRRALTTIQLVMVTRRHRRDQGDKGLYLQDTIDQRQEWTHAKIDEIHGELDAGRRRSRLRRRRRRPGGSRRHPAEPVDHGPARVPERLHERRVRGERGQLRPPQLGLLA